MICKKIEDKPAYWPDRYELLQISRPYKNSHCFQNMAQLFNLMQDCFPIRACKKVLLKEEILPYYQNSRFFRTYANSNKCLAPCMFELTDVYYINLISIILPSCCFLFKIFLRSSKLINKTKDYICLTKLLPTMTSIRLNYINRFWLFRNVFLWEKTHRYLKNDYQFFDALKTNDREIREICNLLTKVKFHELEWSSPLKSQTLPIGPKIRFFSNQKWMHGTFLIFYELVAA